MSSFLTTITLSLSLLFCRLHERFHQSNINVLWYDDGKFDYTQIILPLQLLTRAPQHIHFKNYTHTHTTTYTYTQSEEEVVDHLPALRASCAKHCPTQTKAYEACKDRIAKLGEGDCEAWYFDFLHCVDHCVAPQAFKKLK